MLKKNRLKLLSAFVLATSVTLTTTQAHAKSPFVFSPLWFKSMYQGLSENTDNVWRGKVVSVINPTTLVIENELSKKQVTVTLLHLYLPANARKVDLDLATRLMQSMVNRNVYVLADSDQDQVYAKLIDGKGTDLNLDFIQNGYYDLNTTTLWLKAEKANYYSAVGLAKQAKQGIWAFSSTQ